MDVEGDKVFLSGDLDYGEKITVIVKKGIRSGLGLETGQESRHVITMHHSTPDMEFLSSGVFLPCENDGILSFRTINVGKLDISIRHIYDNNIPFFMQDNELSGKKSGSYYYGVSRTGDEVFSRTVRITDRLDEWVRTDIDLSDTMSEHRGGAYIVELRYSDYSGDYTLTSSDKKSYKVINRMIVNSDFGIIAKQADDLTAVYVFDLNSTEFVSGAKVRFYSYSNQLLDWGMTASDGSYTYRQKKQPFLITAEKDGMVSMIRTGSGVLDYSSFNTTGVKVSDEDVRCMIFSDRGVYRPGDTINLIALLFQGNKIYSPEHSIDVNINSPVGRKVWSASVRDDSDGIFICSPKISENAVTGDYHAEVSLGDMKFYKNIRIETIVPQKIRVNIETSADRVDLGSRVEANISSAYLFGKPASGARFSWSYSINGKSRVFDDFRDFTFDSPLKGFSAIKGKAVEGFLTDEGKTFVNIDIPDIAQSPSLLSLSINAKVFEDSGRSVEDSHQVEVVPYSMWSGIKTPDSFYVRSGEKSVFPVILLNDEGKPVKGEKLFYTVYRNKRYWWWDYNSRKDFRRHFKQSFNTVKVDEGSFYSSDRPVSVEFTPEEYGEYFIEITGGEGVCRSGYFFGAYRWGDVQGQSADILEVSSESGVMRPGQDRVYTVRTPGKGKLIVTVEKGNQILSSDVLSVEGGYSEYRFSADKQMLPHVYLNFIYVQPVKREANNDLPLRMYTLRQVRVADRSTVITPGISCPDEVRPGKSFDVRLSNSEKKRCTYILWAVDEGILNITDYKTPDPYSHLFSRRMHDVSTVDNYGEVIVPEYGRALNTISTGGSDSASGKRRLNPEEINRYLAAAVWKGRVKSDSNGYAAERISIDDYNGSVRVMAVAVAEDRFGSTEKNVVVRDDLVVQSALPKAVSPGDVFRSPLTLTDTSDKGGNADITVSCDNDLLVCRKSEKRLNIRSGDTENVFFEFEAKGFGKARIRFSVKYNGKVFETEETIPVRPVTSYMYRSVEKTIPAGGKISHTFPESAAGAGAASLILSTLQPVDLDSGLGYLRRYPYACLEQVISSALPQLMMSGAGVQNKEQVEDDINSAIDRLSDYQRPSGGFSYWPNGKKEHIWATTYAGLFMVEAQKKGYYIPSHIMDMWMNYSKSQCIAPDGDITDRWFRVYVMSKTDDPASREMNLIYQNYSGKLDKVSGHLLAGAYYNCGESDIAQDILDKSADGQNSVVEHGNNFGSDNRDKGLILSVLLDMDDEQAASAGYREVAGVLNSNQYLSTQDTGLLLYGALSYMEKYGVRTRISARLGGAEDRTLGPAEGVLRSGLVQADGGTYTVQNSGNSDLYSVFSWEGIPGIDNVEEVEKGISVRVSFVDEFGQSVNTSEITQGEKIFLDYEIRNNTGRYLDNMVLSQIMPAGWEIEDTSLSGGNMPSFLKRSSYDHLDIRDDRVSWFFDMPVKVSRHFNIAVNTVTPGSYVIPPAVCEDMYDGEVQAVKKHGFTKISGWEENE